MAGGRGVGGQRICAPPHNYSLCPSMPQPSEGQPAASVAKPGVSSQERGKATFFPCKFYLICSFSDNLKRTGGSSFLPGGRAAICGASYSKEFHKHNISAGPF